jgi:hypothetical protein
MLYINEQFFLTSGAYAHGGEKPADGVNYHPLSFL